MRTGRDRLNEKMRRPLNGKPKRTYVLVHKDNGEFCTVQVNPAGEKAYRDKVRRRFRGKPGVPNFVCTRGVPLKWQPIERTK